MHTFEEYPNKYYNSKNKNSHFHEIEGTTWLSDRHDHEFYGRTLKTIGKGSSHYHIFEGITTFDEGHEHLINLKTGPAVLIDSLIHTHFLEGKTSINSRHSHILKERLPI